MRTIFEQKNLRATEWTFEPGYPLIDRIILYEQKIEVVTGKHSSGLYH
jgi:hypothetical protein